MWFMVILLIPPAVLLILMLVFCVSICETSDAGGRGLVSDLRAAVCRAVVLIRGGDPSVCSNNNNNNAGPSYFVGTASGGSTNPGQISVSAPQGAVVQHFEGYVYFIALKTKVKLIRRHTTQID